jgi:branched-chain amino acid transport system ATP-binding protein
MLKILNLESGYGSLRVLKGLSLHVSPGEAVAILGANGAGKSTLLKTIVGNIKLNAGQIIFNKVTLNGQSSEKIVGFGCSLVPEGRHVFSTLTVRENLILGAYLRWRTDTKENIEKSLQEVYELFSILKERENQLAGTLSGGQQQMLAIGRALMSKPVLLMMDEPSLGAAPLVVRDIYKAIATLKSKGLTILLVEQNARIALTIADRGYVLETGQIVLEGTCQKLCNNPEVQRAYLGKEYQRIDE